MNKFDFFMAAMAANEYRRRAWIISAFALIREGVEDWRKDPYSYRIVQSPTGFFYVDPQKDGELTQIEGATAGQPLFHVKERLSLPAGRVDNLAVDVETNYGNLLFNYIAVIYPFGNKIPYQTGRVMPGYMEDLIIDRLQDDPLPGDPLPKSMPNVAPIYVSEYLRFADAMFFLAGLTQLVVPAGTPKTMTAAPGIVELKKKLLKENEGRLSNAATIAKIQAELVAYDKAYMKGDPGENFLITGKSFAVVRSKLFGMHGAEVGLDEGVDVDLIENSLSQSWDIKKFPAMNNSLRAGSFNRGAQTMLGGESVKWLLRASSNISVTAQDCGSTLGNELNVTGENYQWIEGFTIVDGDGAIDVNKQTSKNYIGKSVIVRSPMYCKLGKTDYCARCVGERLAQNPTGLSAAISEYGSAFLSIYMAAAHGKALTVAKMNFKTAIQ